MIPFYTKYSLLANVFVFGTLLGITYLAIWILSDFPLLAVIPIALGGLFGIWYTQSKKLLIIFLLFALAGTGQEIFFITHGLWSYEQASLFSVPFFLPFVWGNIALLTVALYKAILLADNRALLYHRLPSYKTISLLFFATLLFSLVSLFLFANHPLVLFGVFIVIDILYIVTLRSLPVALVGAVCMLFGSMGDIVSVHLGIWQYHAAHTIINIPPYIFIGWDIVGLLIVGLYLMLDAPDAPWSRFFQSNRS